jgi:hypothetical protein
MPSTAATAHIDTFFLLALSMTYPYWRHENSRSADTAVDPVKSRRLMLMRCPTGACRRHGCDLDPQLDAAFTFDARITGLQIASLIRITRCHCVQVRIRNTDVAFRTSGTLSVDHRQHISGTSEKQWIVSKLAASKFG